MKTLFSLATAGLISGIVGQAGAESLHGTWLTPPDKKGIVAHVVAGACGNATCGVIARTYDSAGNRVETANLGVRIFWDMTPTGNGSYEGKAFVPLHQKTLPGKAQVSGNQVKVSGCIGPVCQSQVWKRVN